MKLTAIFGMKLCGLGFVLNWILQFIKLQIRLSNTELLLTCLQIAMFVVFILLGLMILIKEFIKIRSDIITLRKLDEEIKEYKKPEWKTHNETNKQ